MIATLWINLAQAEGLLFDIVGVCSGETVGPYDIHDPKTVTWDGSVCCGRSGDLGPGTNV